jgi:RNA polymerase sigma-70 factor (ECF subfamily)
MRWQPLRLANLSGVEDAAVSGLGEPAADRTEGAVVAALRAGDEDAFRVLVRRHHASLVRLATTMVDSRAVAEEVVQETWLAVIKGIDGFQGRSSLRTWIFRIVVNQARRRSAKEARAIPVSFLGGGSEGAGRRPVDLARFVPDGQRWAGHWCEPPAPWTDLPAERFSSKETVAAAANAINGLPGRQREVVALRDIEGPRGRRSASYSA